MLWRRGIRPGEAPGGQRERGGHGGHAGARQIEQSQLCVRSRRRGGIAAARGRSLATARCEEWHLVNFELSPGLRARARGERRGEGGGIESQELKSAGSAVALLVARASCGKRGGSTPRVSSGCCLGPCRQERLLDLVKGGSRYDDAGNAKDNIGGCSAKC